MNYKEVEGIDENGNPTTFKIEIPTAKEVQKMNKGLEALKEIDFELNYETLDDNGYSLEKPIKVTNFFEKEIAIIDKGLRALEIIKDRCNLKVYKNKLGQCFLEGTNILFPISQEKYDLLKEVLLNA